MQIWQTSSRKQNLFLEKSTFISDSEKLLNNDASTFTLDDPNNDSHQNFE